ncbi:tyrosine-protein phosphatase [Oscillospiraceae bacterium OttesenSCG-928-F05]|nr:tyrosine-protein phosphatase [Oscillospiraceae bacterium OttesenSCG-928-F05]
MNCANPYRRLPLKSVFNVRDLGGYPTEDGGVTRYGVFFRTANPDAISKEDIDVLKSYRVTTSIDFRDPEEASRAEKAFGGQFDWHNVPVFDPRTVVESTEFFGTTLDALYITIVDTRSETLLKALKIIAAAEGSVMYNCFAGKDRTGIVSAALLSIAGVDTLDILADYMVSGTYLKTLFAHIPENHQHMCASGPEIMQGLLEHVEKAYGGMVPYLKKIGVSEDEIRRIHDRFVLYP